MPLTSDRDKSEELRRRKELEKNQSRTTIGLAIFIGILLLAFLCIAYLLSTSGAF
jgi:hypothetical protein